MKKIISVLLCIAMMFTFLTVISSAADGAAGNETIFDIIVNLLTHADWASILNILRVTIQTFLRIIGAAA